MQNLRNTLAVMIAVLFTTTNAANAWFIPEANSSSISSISVSLNDLAQDACWTNLREAREYAEEKLNIESYNVLADDGEYFFDIQVMAKRDNRETCYGHIGISIWASHLRNGIFGFHNVGGSNGLFLNSDNFNNNVIEMISSMVAEM